MSPESGQREVFLNPGEFAFGDAWTRIRTILGSCVAVTFWHPGLRVGAMCHYLLPCRTGSESEPPGGKYAEEVIPLIAARFAKRGLGPRTFQVKMFGGSNMFPHLSLGEALGIGTKNIHTGMDVLDRCGFTIANFDLAGGTNRTVVFDLRSGEVWVRQGQVQVQRERPRPDPRRGGA